MDGINRPDGIKHNRFDSDELNSPQEKRKIIPNHPEPEDERVTNRSIGEYQIQKNTVPHRRNEADDGYVSDNSNHASSSDSEQNRAYQNTVLSKPLVKLLKKCFADEGGVKSEILEGVNTCIILRDTKNQPRFIFKPSNGESALGRYGEVISYGIPTGKFYLREIVPMLFDDEQFFPVPETFIWKLDSLGSCQKFVPDATPMGRKIIQMERVDFIDKEDLARLAILDIIIGNQDRHLNNILISGNRAFGIDHGLSMSSLPDEEINIETPDISQYKQEISEDIIGFCQRLYLTKRVKIQEKLLALGIEKTAVKCCMERICILYELLIRGRKQDVSFSVHEVAHLGKFLSKYVIANDFEKVILPKINGLLKLKKEVNEVLENGTRTEKIRVKYNAQFPTKKFIQDEMAKMLMISVDEAANLWNSAFWPVIK